MNSAGKLLIPRHAAKKKIALNGLDYSVACHVESGESYEQSFIRETREELGIDLTTCPWREFAKFNDSK